MDNNTFASPDDYAFSFSDEPSESANKKLFAAICNIRFKAFAANVLIGHVPTKKLNEHVGDTFYLWGFHIKNIKFKDNREGKYTVLFGESGSELCAYATSSDKICEALTKIRMVYGEPPTWDEGINVKIRMNSTDNITSYSLEIV